MAYTSFVPATFDELLSQIADFASTTMGWSASYGSSTATLTPKPGEADFVLTWQDNGSYGYHLDCDVTKGANSFLARASHMAGLANVWLFAGTAPEPWLHIVINSQPGQYHHLYLGYLERYGVWDCGAIASGTAWDNTPDNRDSWSSSYNSMLFSGVYNFSRNGGMIMEGANPPVPKGLFCDDDPGAGWARLRGGYQDADNWRLVNPGLPLHNAAAPMAPFLIRADFEKDDFYVPLGSPPGVRMLHIEDFNPEQIITFGANDWQVFPLGDKHRDGYYQNWPEYPNGEYNKIVGVTGARGVAVLRA